MIAEKVERPLQGAGGCRFDIPGCAIPKRLNYAVQVATLFAVPHSNDQRLCFSLHRYCNPSTFEIPSLYPSTDVVVSDLVGSPKDRFPCDVAFIKVLFSLQMKKHRDSG